MNKVILIGNLTKDVESASTQSGIKYARFTLAVKGFTAEEVYFINIVAWRGLAENCAKYLTKGRKCGVVGSLQTRSYDAKDGTKKYVTEVVASEVEFLSPVSNGTSETAPAIGEPDLTPIDDDKLPF